MHYPLPTPAYQRAVTRAEVPTYPEPSRPIGQRTPKFCLHGEKDQGARTPQQWAILLAAQDEAADREFAGGLDISRSNQCQTCFEQKSRSGACHNCDEPTGKSLTYVKE